MPGQRSVKDDKRRGNCKTGLITTDDVVVTDTLECIAAAGAVVSTKTGADAVDDCDAAANADALQSVQVTNVYKPMFPVHFRRLQFDDGSYKSSATAGMRTQ